VPQQSSIRQVPPGASLEVSKSGYDRVAAADYAKKYWTVVCSDSFIAGKDMRPPNPDFVRLPNARFRRTDGEEIAVTKAQRIPYEQLDDCTHFVSCCIGAPPVTRGGGLPMGATSSGPPPRGPYGVISSLRLLEYLLSRRLAVRKSSVEELRQGDLIRYTGYVGRRQQRHWCIIVETATAPKIACHTVCRIGDPWNTVGTTWSSLEHTFVHIL
jgi:hypothetical protein